MPHPPHRPRWVVVSDLDGTLLDGGGLLTTGTVAAVARLRAAGGLFVVATARPLADALPVARAAGADLLVCAGGAVLAEPATGAVRAVAAFPEPGRVVAALRAGLPGVLLGLDDGASCPVDPGFEPDWETHSAVERRPGPVAPGAARPLLKVLLQLPGHDADAVAARAAPVLGELAEVTVSCPAFAEALPPGVDKATHLRRLFPPGGPPTVAFGDMPGDLPLLAWADTAVAVANAHPAVLAAAGHVTSAHDEDGVAAVLDALTAPDPTRATT